MTAEEHFKKYFKASGYVNQKDLIEWRIEFTKYHVQLALKAAHRNMQLPEEDLEFTLSSYNLNNIK